MRRAKYISKVDLKNAYFQIPLDEESKKYTAFAVPGSGLWQFKRMPFGLTNAPATFQRLIDALFGPEMEPHVFGYLDDIIKPQKHSRNTKNGLRWYQLKFVMLN